MRKFQHSDRLEQHAIVWVIVALVPAALIHWEIIPVWLSVFCGLVTLYRYAVYRGRLPEANRWAKGLLMLSLTGLFVWSVGGQFSVESAVTFFVLAYGLKMLELTSRRDAYIFSFMTLFLLAISLLFSQSVFRTIYVFCFMGLGLVSLMAVNAPVRFTSLAASLGRVYMMMALALPLLVLLYVVFPRFGPLWSMPLKSQSAFTGLDDNVSPGDVSSLAQSAERAFRVSFKEERPLFQNLYWRGLVLDRYESGRWSRSFYQQLEERRDNRIRLTGDEYDYEILLDPHNREWGFALENSVSVAGEAYSPDVGLVRFNKDIKSATWYRARSTDRAQVAPNSAELASLVRLTPGENPRTREWAAEIMSQTSSESERIDFVLSYLNQQPFFYTLNPPLLPPSDRADEFLFNSRKGFCEHYASSVGVLFRAMGIPTRMITGYQGGEWNEQGEFIVVHQYDAHAWLEVWLNGSGWVRVDPTAAVAPDRVRSGIRDAVAEEGSFLQDSPLSLARFDHINLIAWMRQQSEYLNYLWISSVVNYDLEDQRSLLGQLFGRSDIKAIAIVLVVSVCLVFLAMTLLTIWPEWRLRKKEQLHHLYAQFVGKLANVDSRIHTGMTPRQLVLATGSLVPEERRKVRHLAEMFEAVFYQTDSGDQSDSSGKAAQIKKQLRRLTVKSLKRRTQKP